MAKTLVGLFDTFAQAQHVADALTKLGIDQKAISVVSRSHDAEVAPAVVTEELEPESSAAEAAGTGAVGGTVVGGTLGLLAGLGALAIPGIGPVIAAGPLAAALGTTALGAGIGAATGSLLGALVGAGVPEEEASMYAEGVRRGGTLVSVAVDDQHADRVYNIMQESGAVDVSSRGAGWRESGWTRFDEEAEPYDIDANDHANWRESHEQGGIAGATAGATTGAAMGASSGPIGTLVGSVVGAVEGMMGNIPNDTTETTTYNPNANTAANRAEAPKLNNGSTQQQDSAMNDPKDLSDQNDMSQGEHGHGWGWSDYERDFRADYDARYSASGAHWDNYAPAYRYGHDAAQDSRYQGRSWQEMEATLSGSWDAARYGPWEQFKDAVHTAWDRTVKR